MYNVSIHDCSMHTNNSLWYEHPIPLNIHNGERQIHAKNDTSWMSSQTTDKTIHTVTKCFPMQAFLPTITKWFRIKQVIEKTRKGEILEK